MAATTGLTLPSLASSCAFVDRLLTSLSDDARAEHGIAAGATAVLDEEQLAGGLSADTRGCSVGTAKFVLKRGKGDGIDREVAVYREVGLLPADLTVQHVCSGADENGVQHLLLVDARPLGYTQAGLYFGPSSPLNYGKELPAGSGEEQTVLAIAKAAATQAGSLHGSTWGQATSLADSRPWLRVSPGAGDMKESDVAYSTMILGFGKAGLDTLRAHAEAGSVTVSDALVDDVDSAISAAAALLDSASGADARAGYKLPLDVCLVHGDFHPGNQLWNATTESSRFVDLEQVGLGSGPQELGQYLISHLSPTERKAYEGRIIDVYVATLCECLPSNMSVDKQLIRTEVIVGGYLRWLWLLGALGGMVPPPMLQGFIDKMEGFRNDHGAVLKPTKGMPVRL